VRPDYLVLAFAIGVVLATQAGVNGQLAVALRDDTIVAGLVSFVIGTVAIAVGAAIKGGAPAALLLATRQPVWLLSGGVLGAAALLATTFLAPRIGLATLLALVVTGQLLSSLVIDHFGLLGRAVTTISAIKVVGTILMLAGITLALFGDRLLEAIRPQ
jgi:bacterial/archaeal transporter family-2 protein